MPQGTEAPAGTMAEGPTSHTQKQAGGLAKLREEFPASLIQALPKLWCKRCSDSRNKVCEDHRKAKCNDCGNYITTAHVDLSYVGHAELTHRLLDADPLWDWEPVAFDQRGLPQFDENGGLWIRLTVCGHSRLGYGDSQGKKGPNAVKEAIGDALRNAAMRFGAALDLWAKSDLREAQTEHPKTADDDAHYTPAPRQAASSPSASKPAIAAEASSGDDPLPRLVDQYKDCWGNPTALLQIRIDGKKQGVSDRSVQGPPPGNEWMTFDALLEARIGELRAAQGGDTERSAA
ncbi:hypothetical protein ACIQHU_38990 [Streptomyces tendae]|uniref:hypothetical protein n=1 Tax=Streptomyces tendae TaxID=1932 RepID=UPI00381AD34F